MLQKRLSKRQLKQVQVRIPWSKRCKKEELLLLSPLAAL